MTQKELRFPPKRFVALFIAYHDYLRVSCYTEIFFVERDVRYIAINNGAVKRIFDLCVAGNGPMRIAKTLKADNMRPLCKAERTYRKGKGRTTERS